MKPLMKPPGEESKQNLWENARQKLKEKNLDLLVANPIGEEGAGFAASTNRVVVFDRAGREDHWPQMKKTEIAWKIWVDALYETLMWIPSWR